MNLSDYTFVALDLETTGLDPTKETIIEVAAVRFQLERDGDIFRAVKREERSMLINPGKPMTEEISMITGITDSMLLGKPLWNEVKERVEVFIGDAIIVGHNVLFDIAMLRTHGVDLMRHIALDTFELSEIFSQDAESLNLGFLGKKYKIEMESEHRALDDTKLSIVLFLLYLKEITLLDKKYLSIWGLARDHESEKIFSTLLDICDVTLSDSSYSFCNPLSFAQKGEEPSIDTQGSQKNEYTIMSLSGEKKEFLDLIENEVQSGLPLLLITPNKKQSEYLSEELGTLGYRIFLDQEQEKFVDLEMVEFWIKKEKWKRKESILLVKILTWLETTETGLLDELKYYGDERNMVRYFQYSGPGGNRFYTDHLSKLQNSEIIITNYTGKNLDHTPKLKKAHNTIFTDILWIEDMVRREKSHHISFRSLYESLESLGGDEEYLITGLSMVSEIYRETPSRPTGTNAFPPGDFGETYFITQKELWHRGYRWLVLGSQKFESGRERLMNFANTTNHMGQYHREKLVRDIDILLDMTYNGRENISIVVHIDESDTRISFIPRSVNDEISKTIQAQSGIKTVLTGFGISDPISKRFLEKECGISGNIETKESRKIMRFKSKIEILGHKTVILTTSTKHARMLAKEMKENFGISLVYAQGISGGKGKMLSLFESTKEKSVLIGIIDNWIDESSLWKSVDEVIIAKIPFQPPTDPYFLARTVGMKNNFEEYSTPIALATINTLIGRIKFSNPTIEIFCTDERIETMNWGQDMRSKFL